MEHPTPVTGWNNGLSQDYNKGLAKWFSTRPNACQEVRDIFLNKDTMKFPKHRSNMYIVMRETYQDSPTVYDSLRDATPVGVFTSAEAADDFRGACEQEFKEKGFDSKDYYFSVVLSTYYEG